MAIDIHSCRWESKQTGNIYEFWIDSAEDIKDLPIPGEWAALTSIALDVSTFDVYILRRTGWVKGGGGT